jgi:hypothetical protein
MFGKLRWFFLLSPVFFFFYFLTLNVIIIFIEVDKKSIQKLYFLYVSLHIIFVTFENNFHPYFFFFFKHLPNYWSNFNSWLQIFIINHQLKSIILIFHITQINFNLINMWKSVFYIFLSFRVFYVAFFHHFKVGNKLH